MVSFYYGTTPFVASCAYGNLVDREVKAIRMTSSVSTGSLAFHIRRLIEASGPLTVARYMNEALNNPDLGYYRTR